ncbi:peptidoglycan-recognition protein SB2 isoform X1 [Bombyx mori]|uniref:Peptidoglycan recognition protein family domain-containing protein n=1 Tax=Bombyx mori TaxID=7091 RepID=A0A8R2DM51_BOMMO|nr:peptidoglycan-recognition protein SB2 isoform X1 [Bombyx mori]
MVEIQLHSFASNIHKLCPFIHHEFRQNNSHRADSSDIRQSEETPLLHTFPRETSPEENNWTSLTVSLLLVILISGIIIGVYLLIIQSDSENVLPPVEMPLQFVSRLQWDTLRKRPVLSSSSFRAKSVVAVQTDSILCWATESCFDLLQHMQENDTSNNTMAYNFLISSNGQTYESLGWHVPSPMFPKYSNSSLVFGFIGNFTDMAPSSYQIDGAEKLLAVSVSQQYLEPNYVLVGRKTKERPVYLFSILKKFPQWDEDNSD